MEEKYIEEINKIKSKDEKYLFELQKFLDSTENIKDEELKLKIRHSALEIEQRIIKICGNFVNKNIKK